MVADPKIKVLQFAIILKTEWQELIDSFADKLLLTPLFNRALKNPEDTKETYLLQLSDDVSIRHYKEVE